LPRTTSQPPAAQTITGPSSSNSFINIWNQRPTRLCRSEISISSRAFSFRRLVSFFSVPKTLSSRAPDTDNVSSRIPVISAIRACARRLSALRVCPTRRAG
jgi:hypothetical protein